MLYLIAFLCPPLAILLCGKPFQALIAIPLCVVYFPATLWAVLVVSSHGAERRHRELMRNADKNSEKVVKAIKGQRPATQVVQVNVWQPAQVQPEAQSQPPRVKHRPPTTAIPAPVVPAPEPIAQAVGPVRPRKPLFTVAGVRSFVNRSRAGLAQAREGAAFAYANLPEWAQPITWGLAAATPITVVLMAWRLLR